MNRKSHAPAILLLAGGIAILPLSTTVWAASCCGGGSASSLLLPKFSRAISDASLDFEQYNGFWNREGEYTPNPPGSDLNQYRLNLGYAYRFAPRWQGSITVPYVWNQNHYAGLKSSTSGVGDATLSLWYENFDGIRCVWKVRSIEDLKPATYFGATLTIPTGISPYDDVSNSFGITGRGFYRLDGNILLDKTIYPWNASLTMSYGTYFQRPVNREYGNYIEPYRKRFGNRLLITISGGYTQFLESMNTITYTLAWSHLQEDEGKVNGHSNPASGFRKRSVAATVAFATFDRDWVIKLSWSHALRGDGWGENFPTTDVYTVGVSHVYR